MKIISYLPFLLFFCATLFADPATVTNNGNIEVRVQYKQSGSDYQDMTLKPGESKELPGGVEKVKLVRQPGEGATPAKAGENINVTVKEGDKVVGTAGWYGDKVFFQSPTASPATQVQIQGEQPPAGTKPATGAENKTEPAAGSNTAPAKDSAGAPATPTTPKAETAPASGGMGRPGSITNNGFLPMTVTVTSPDGSQQTHVVGMDDTLILPPDMTGISIKQPMIFSGYTFGKKAVDLELQKPSGENETIEEIPFEGLEINMKPPAATFEYHWKYDLKSGLDYNFGDELKWKKKKEISSNDALYEEGHSDYQHQY